MADAGSVSTVRIGLVLPDVMGTYGDGGNALVLRQRLRLRGIAAEIVEITLADPVPDSLDLSPLGGAEEFGQRVTHRQARGGVEEGRKARVGSRCGHTAGVSKW